MATITIPPAPTPPNLPDPSERYDARYERQFSNVLRLFFNTVTNAIGYILRTHIGGTVTFAAATTATVTFSNALPNAIYYVGLSGNAAGYCWVTSKTKTGFVVNCSASNSNSTDWVIL